MKENTHYYFKLKGRVAFMCGVVAVGIPALLYWGINGTYQSYEFRGRKKGDQVYFPK
jgi:hypothetical protein